MPVSLRRVVTAGTNVDVTLTVAPVIPRARRVRLPIPSRSSFRAPLVHAFLRVGRSPCSPNPSINPKLTPESLGAVREPAILAGGRSLRKPSVSTGAHSMRAGPARFAGWGAGRSIIPWVVLDAFHRRSVEPLGRTSRSSHAPVRVVGWYLPWHVSIRGAIWSQVRRDCCYGGTALSASVAVQELRVEVVLLLPLPALMPAMCFMDPRTAKTTWRGWNLLFHTTFLTTPIPADSQVLIIQAAEAATLVPLHPQVVKQAC
mmetsp:Transcript_25633/g.61026  ORF Transcript_25633/g.61026 Transcript_25633/m.61026 type:complete len:259 (-) Transcript_25633:213-989(-)